MTDPLTGPLSVDKHLKMVREATWDVRAQWYDTGVELGISVGTLQVSTVNKAACQSHTMEVLRSVQAVSLIYTHTCRPYNTTITTLLEHVLQTC